MRNPLKSHKKYLTRYTAFQLLLLSGTAFAIPVDPSEPGGGGGGSTTSPSNTSEWNVPGDGNSVTTSPWLELGKLSFAYPQHLSSASAKGDASYTMDLNLPPALLKPSFNLSYGSSNAVNGEMPYGWSLGGIVEITRPTERAFSEHEWHFSGPTGGILTFTGLTTSGTVTYADFILKTSTGDYITARRDLSDDTWLVFSKEGILWELSPVDDGSAPQGVGRWRVSSATDLTGNTIAYTYDTSGRLSTMEYGGNSTTGEGHLVKVVMNYTTTAHSFTNYSAGVLNTFDKVAESIDIYTRSTGTGTYAKIRRYSFTLKTDSNAGQVLLSDIKELGYSSSTSYKTISLASFTYSEYDNSSSKSTSMEYNKISSYSYTYKEGTHDFFPTSWGREGSRFIDFNGDGLLDRVFGGFSGKTFDSAESPSDNTWSVTYQTYDSETDTYSLDTSYSFEGPEVATNETFTESEDEMGSDYGTRPKYVYTTGQMIDVNGDGLPDVIVSNGSTSWDVYYNTGDALGTPFDGPYTETAPWTYSGLSYAMDADKFPTWTTSTLRQLIDIDGDGWLDCFSGTSVYYHNGTKGGGWTVGSMSSALGAYTRKVALTVENDPVPDTNQDRQYYVSQTAETGGLYDINGDGLVDWVSATSTSWSVKLGNTQGFASAVVWASPLANISVTKEGYPTVGYTDSYGYARSFTGWEQEVLQGLTDVNGDGYIDLVSFDGNSKGWYQNLGNGFSLVAQTLPSWWPEHLSSAQLSSVAYVDTGTTGTVYSSMTSSQRDSIVDINHDGMPDFGNGDGSVYGEYPRPYLLIKVDNKKGLTSTMDYQPSSTVSPAGEPDKEQNLSATKHLVKSISSLDSITGQSAKTTFEYSDGYLKDDVFQGFSDVSVMYSINGCTYLKQLSEYELSNYFEPINTQKRSYTYHCGDYNSSLKSFLTSTEGKLWIENYTYDDVTSNHYLPSSYRVLEYSSDYSDYQSYTISYDYNEYGDMILLSHNGGGDSFDSFEVDMEYTGVDHSSSGGHLSRLARETISGYDPINSVNREFQDKQWLYDSKATYDSAISKGLLTTVRLSSGWYDGSEDVEDSYLEWDMTRGSRGELKTVTEADTGKKITQTLTFGSAVVKTKKNNLSFGITNTVNSRGLVTAVTNAQGVKTSYTLDAFDRKTKETITPIGGSALTLSATTFYDTTTPRYKKEVVYKASGTTDSTEYNYFDGSGDVVQSWNQIYSGAYVATDSIDNLLGKPLYTTHPVSKGTTVSYSGLNATSYMKERSYYDGLGNEVSTDKDVKNSIGTAIVDLTEPREKVTEDEEGYMTLFEYDAHKRITSVSSLSRMLAGDTYITLEVNQGYYEYDPLNRVVKYTDPNNVDYKYSYDGAGRLRKSSGADIGTHTFEYKGMTKSKMEDSSGGYAEWEFDSIMRPVSLTISDPLDLTDSVSEYSWSYDSELKGMLDTSTDPTGSTSYDYDTYGRVKTATRVFDDGVSATFKKTYDLLNRISTNTYPSTEVLTNTYANGWLTKQSDKSGVYTQYTYDSYGRISSWKSSKGPTATRTYNGLFLDTIAMTYGSTTCTFDYSFYKNGLLASKKDCLLSTDSSYEISYSYDHMKQLSAVKSSSATLSDLESFSYDSAGNLESLKTTAGINWTYDAAGTLGTTGNQIPSRSSSFGTTESYTYDLAGRKSTEDNGSSIKEYVYDGLSRLRAVYEDGAIILALDYDADNNILRRADSDPFGASIPSYTYSFEDWRYEEDGGLTTENIMKVMSLENGSRRWLFREHDGNVAITADDSGVLLGSKQFSSYGSSWKSSGDTWDLSSYHGSTLEDESDLFSMGQRHLNQKDGTWLQPEPLLYLGLPSSAIANPKSFATYRYSANNPANYSDLTGFNPNSNMTGEQPQNSTDSQADERRQGSTEGEAQNEAANEETDEEANAAHYDAEPVLVTGDGIISYREGSFSFGVGGVTGSIGLAQDQYGQTYLSIGGGMGTPGFGACFGGGEINRDLKPLDNSTVGDATAEGAQEFMTGLSGSVFAGTPLGGIGYVDVPAQGDLSRIGGGVQGAACFPGATASATINYTWLIGGGD